MPDDWITTEEATALTGYHVVSIRRLIKAGKVRGQKFLTVWQVSRSSLMAYVASQAKKGEKRGPKADN